MGSGHWASGQTHCVTLFSGPQPPSYQTGTEESPLLTVPTLRHDIVPSPLQAYFQTHYDKKGESGSYSPLPPAWACGLSTQSRGLTWLLGSQGTERGISACLQDTMYFLEERRRQPWSLGSPCLSEDFSPCAQPSRDEGLLSGQGGRLGTQKTGAESLQPRSEAEQGQEQGAGGRLGPCTLAEQLTLWLSSFASMLSSLLQTVGSGGVVMKTRVGLW